MSKMRSYEEMLELILTTAKQDPRIRAVIMNGSRVNPNVRPDIFQDYDIVYLVNDLSSFTDDHTWIDRFGELMIMQMPEAMVDPPPMNNGTFSYLMQFIDGNRIDLGLFPLTKLDDFQQDSLSVLLLDKDNIFEPFSAPNDTDYLVKPPNAEVFSNCCNEFWWVSTYVAKGLWREQITYAKDTLEIIRVQLIKMLSWHVGVQTNFSGNPGGFGKHLQKYLTPDLWTMLEKTYADSAYDNTWDSLITMTELFRTTATTVAEHFGFDYPLVDDQRVSNYLAHVRALPKDAKAIY